MYSSSLPLNVSIASSKPPCLIQSIFYFPISDFTSAWYSFWKNFGLEKSESIKEMRTKAVADNGGNPLSVTRTVRV